MKAIKTKVTPSMDSPKEKVIVYQMAEADRVGFRNTIDETFLEALVAKYKKKFHESNQN